MKKKTESQPRLRVGVRSQKVGRAVPARRAAALEQEQPRDRARGPEQVEGLLAAIWRTEAAFTVARRTLADLRAKHHRQCAELAQQLRRSTINSQPSTGAK